MRKRFSLITIRLLLLFFQAVLYEPLPSDLAKPDQITNDQKYGTTTGTFHDRKYKDGKYGNSPHVKAPSLRKVNYIKDHVEQV